MGFIFGLIIGGLFFYLYYILKGDDGMPNLVKYMNFKDDFVEDLKSILNNVNTKDPKQEIDMKSLEFQLEIEKYKERQRLIELIEFSKDYNNEIEILEDAYQIERKKFDTQRYSDKEKANKELEKARTLKDKNKNKNWKLFEKAKEDKLQGKATAMRAKDKKLGELDREKEKARQDYYNISGQLDNICEKSRSDYYKMTGLGDSSYQKAQQLCYGTKDSVDNRYQNDLDKIRKNYEKMKKEIIVARDREIEEKLPLVEESEKKRKEIESEKVN